MYNDKSAVIDNFIKYINKNIYFRNVTYFIERVKNIIKVKKIELKFLYLFLKHCFRLIYYYIYRKLKTID